jgi:hypothetical protein
VTAPAAAGGEGEYEGGCPEDYLSTDTQKVLPGLIVHPQNVYSVSPLQQFLFNFVPDIFNLDALHVLSPNELLFSIEKNGFIPTPQGNVFLLHNQVYRLTVSCCGDWSVELDPEWAALGLTLPSLNAIYRYPSELMQADDDDDDDNFVAIAGACYAWSTATTGVGTQNGWSAFLRPWQVFRSCPCGDPELIFNAGTLGITNVDALHVDGCEVQFSVAVDKLLSPGGLYLRKQNVYRCSPSGAGQTCTEGDLSLQFDGVSHGINDLDGYTPGCDVSCYSGCTE